jgi:hypothetical protein
MFLLGRANWWLPGPLARRLTRIAVEKDPELPEDAQLIFTPTH